MASYEPQYSMSDSLNRMLGTKPNYIQTPLAITPYASVQTAPPLVPMSSNQAWMSSMGIDPSNVVDYSGIEGVSFGDDLSFGDTASSPSWFSGMGEWASKNKELINGGVGLAQAGLGAFNAWNTNQTAKDQLKFQKESFGKQYEAQKGLTNSQLADRQDRRYNSRPDIYESKDAYMAKYGVK